MQRTLDRRGAGVFGQSAPPGRPGSVLSVGRAHRGRAARGAPSRPRSRWARPTGSRTLSSAPAVAGGRHAGAPAGAGPRGGAPPRVAGETGGRPVAAAPGAPAFHTVFGAVPALGGRSRCPLPERRRGQPVPCPGPRVRSAPRLRGARPILGRWSARPKPRRPDGRWRLGVPRPGPSRAPRPPRCPAPDRRRAGPWWRGRRRSRCFPGFPAVPWTTVMGARSRGRGGRHPGARGPARTGSRAPRRLPAGDVPSRAVRTGPLRPAAGADDGAQLDPAGQHDGEFGGQPLGHAADGVVVAFFQL